MIELLTADGRKAPPSDFAKRLEAFDPNLRAVWGLGQLTPFAGWVIERRIPAAMKARVYADSDIKPANRERYADQVVLDEHGNVALRRAVDMMPDWHPVYQVMDEEGEPILELGEFVIDYLRRNYDRTLLGVPELGLRHLSQDRAEKAIRDRKRKDELADRQARLVMDHKYEIWPEVMAFSGQPRFVKEGTEI